MWLHHEMDPVELTHHFGVNSPQQVNPDIYQVIQIHSDKSDQGLTESKIIYELCKISFKMVRVYFYSNVIFNY